MLVNNDYNSWQDRGGSLQSVWDSGKEILYKDGPVHEVIWINPTQSVWSLTLSATVDACGDNLFI